MESAAVQAPSHCWAEPEPSCAALPCIITCAWVNRASAAQCDQGQPPYSSSSPAPTVTAPAICPADDGTQHCLLSTAVPQPWPVVSSCELVWSWPSWTFLRRSTMKPGKLDWLKTVLFSSLFLMTPNSYVKPLQLVNMCILNFSEKSNLRTEKKFLSWAVSVLVLEYLCAFVFYFRALIIIKGLLYKKNDMVGVYLSLQWFFSRQKKDILQKRNRRPTCL